MKESRIRRQKLKCEKKGLAAREEHDLDMDDEKFIFRMSDRGPSIWRAVLGLLEDLVERHGIEMQNIRRQVLLKSSKGNSGEGKGIDDEELMEEDSNDGEELEKLKFRWRELVVTQGTLERLMEYNDDEITVKHRGMWREYNNDIDEDGNYSLWWKTSRFKRSEISSANESLPRGSQRLNHFPGNARQMTRKDGLVRCLRRSRAVYGNMFNFLPESYILPGEYVKFMERMSLDMKGGEVLEEELPVWICKPSDLSRGRKIFLFRKVSDFAYDQQSVVQRYVEEPLLISGYKFDLRIYALVISFHPLCIYIYEDGLVRFSTSRYSISDLDNHFVHLTNASINKHGMSYNEVKHGIGRGSKWSISKFKEHACGQYGEAKWLKCWARIEELVMLTTVAFTSDVPEDTHCCFEIYGFDVIIDKNWNPLLLEVNSSPSLNADSVVDILVKKPLLSDTIDALQIKKRTGGKAVDGRSSHRLTQRARSSMSRPDKSRPREKQTKYSNGLPFPQRVGQFKLIFPFNHPTYDAAMVMSTAQRQQESMKLILHQIKIKRRAVSRERPDIHNVTLPVPK